MGKDIPVLDTDQRKELEQRMNLLKNVAEYEQRMEPGCRIESIEKRAKIEFEILQEVAKKGAPVARTEPEPMQASRTQTSGMQPQVEELDRNLSIDDVLVFEVAGSEELSMIIAKQAERTVALSQVEKVAESLGLEVQDVVAIMQETGMQLEEVQEVGETLQIDMEQIGAEVQGSISVVPQEVTAEGVIAKAKETTKTRPGEVTSVKVDQEEQTLTISKLDELAIVDKEGQMEMSDYMKEQLQAYEQMGVVIDTEAVELTLTEEQMEQEEQPLEDGGRTVLTRPGRVLKAKTAETLEAEKDEDEEFKSEIAQKVGAKKDDILAAIIIHDRDVGSQMFNQHLSRTANEILLVRLPGNKFELLEKDTSGEYHQLQGLEVTALGNQVAPLLKDKVGGLYTHLYPGEAVAGKTTNGQADYDLFQIRAAGESVDDGLNHMVYVSCNGKSQMDVITNKEGGYELDFARTTSVYPDDVIMDGQEMDVDGIGEEEKQEEVVARRNFDNDFSGSYLEEATLLQELLRIDREIAMIQAEPDVSFSVMGAVARDFIEGAVEGELAAGEAGAAIGGTANAIGGFDEHLEEARKDKENRIADLEAKRSVIQSRLGYSDLYQAREDAREAEDMMRGQGRY